MILQIFLINCEITDNNNKKLYKFNMIYNKFLYFENKKY